MRLERILYVVLMIITTDMIFLAYGFNAKIKYDPLGPESYPIMVLSILLLGLVYLFFENFKQRIAIKQTLLIKKILCIVIIVCYALFFQSIGFPIITFIMVLALSQLFGATKISSLILGVIISATLFLLFDYVLEVTLPLGILDFLIRGN